MAKRSITAVPMVIAMNIAIIFEKNREVNRPSLVIGFDKTESNVPEALSFPYVKYPTIMAIRGIKKSNNPFKPSYAKYFILPAEIVVYENSNNAGIFELTGKMDAFVLKKAMYITWPSADDGKFRGIFAV